MELPTSEVHNPDKPEESLIVNTADVEAGGWVPWGQWSTEAAQVKRGPGRPRKDGAAE